MATKISEYSATPASNTDLDGINLSENVMVPSDVNDALRMQMAHLKEMDTGTSALTSPEFASATMTGDLNFGTNNKAIFGAGDLRIYHDASESIIEDVGTGDLKVRGSDEVKIQVRNAANTAWLNAVVAADAGAVTLSHNNSAKLATTATGVDVTGTVTADGLTVDTDTLHVDSTNNRVGIGTQSPDSALHAFSGINTVLTLENTGQTYQRIETQGTGSAITSRIDASTSNGNLILQADPTNIKSASSIQFEVDGSEHMRLTSAGSLGIGTTTPTNPLHILSSAGEAILISNSNASGNSQIKLDGATDFQIGTGQASSGFANKLFFYDATNAATRLVIDSSGIDVTGTAKSDLVVVDSTGGATPTYSHTNNGEGITLRYNDDGGARAADIVAIGNNPAGATMAMRFFLNPNSTDAAAEVMRIQNGNVGIGTASASQKLTVEGTANNQNSEIKITASGVASGYLGSNSDGLNIGTDSHGIVFKTGVTGGGSVGATGTERMRIDSSGNLTLNSVGSGDIAIFKTTANSGTGLYINSQTANQIDLVGYDGSAANAVNIRAGGATGSGLTVNTSNKVGIGTVSPPQKFVVSNAGADNIVMSENSSASIQMFMQATSGTGSVGTLTNHDVQFLANNSEKARITSAGDFLIGTTSTTSNERVRISNGNDTRAISFQSASAAECGYIYINGGGTSVTYSTSSDYRLKENVTVITNATDRLKQLNPVRFNFIADADTTVDGFIAHEAQAVVPEAVTGTHNEVNSDGNDVYQGIDQSKLVPLLTAALQEALTKIDQLETRITALEA